MRRVQYWWRIRMAPPNDVVGSLGSRTGWSAVPFCGRITAQCRGAHSRYRPADAAQFRASRASDRIAVTRARVERPSRRCSTSNRSLSSECSIGCTRKVWLSGACIRQTAGANLVTDTGRLGRARPHPAIKTQVRDEACAGMTSAARAALVATLGAIKNNLALVEEAIAASTDDAREDASAAE